MSQQYRFASVSGAAFALSVFTICILLLTVSQADSVATTGSQQKLAPAAVFTVNSTADTDDGLCNSATPGGCTLREAINAANANAGADTIEFNLGTGTPTINVGTTGFGGLPQITDPVIINGNTGGATRVELSGGSAVGMIGLIIRAGNSKVQWLVVNRFNGSGIALTDGGNNTISDCFLGTDSTGALARPNRFTGVDIQSSNNVIVRNVISGNEAFGIRIIFEEGNFVQGNFIGVDATGNAALGNLVGVQCDSTGNTIGGSAAGTGNVISGNVQDGIEFTNNSDNNIVQGNFIGTNAAGSAALGNGFNGVKLYDGSQNNLIGGAIAGEGNVISGNLQNGILIEPNIFGDPSNTRVEGNFIGTNISGAAGLGNAFDGVRIEGTLNCTVGGPTGSQGNVISGNGQNGIRILNGGSNTVSQNTIGRAPFTSTALPNGENGILIDNSTNNTVAGNVIVGNTEAGVQMINLGATANSIRGNLIGISFPDVVIGNRDGVVIDLGASNNQIGDIALPPNTISGNRFRGVLVLGAGTTNNSVGGNFIGTNAAGAAGLGNAREGVRITDGATSVSVYGNRISGNGADGVLIEGSGTTNHLISLNLIGTTPDGTAALPNAGNGVQIRNGATNNTIGRPEANIISGNAGAGIFLASNNNLIEANGIGISSSGIDAIPNATGVVIAFGASSNIIGGSSPPARNFISGNLSHGISIEGNNNKVESNFIGTTSFGTAPLANGGDGIIISDAPDNRIGSPGAGNVISGNSGSGIRLFKTNTRNTLIQGNLIGTNAAGTGDLGNSQSGIAIDAGASSNSIGASLSGAGNTIAFNDTDGIRITSGAFNTILSNSIFSNGALGIELGVDGPTANDDCDPDLGANNFQNYPLLNAATTGGGTTTITGAIKSNPNTTYIVEFFSSAACDSSGRGEGEVFIGSTTVTTDASCAAEFVKTISPAIPAGRVITATATVPDKDTSEFSACRQVLDPTAVEFASARATGYDEGVVIEWQTGFEVDNLGFNVYREQAGERALITPEMVAGSALLAGPGTRLTAGRSYWWVDRLPRDKQGAFYWIEDVDLNGQSRWHGPVVIQNSELRIENSILEQHSRLLTKLAGDKTRGARPDCLPVERASKLPEITRAQTQIQSSLASRPAIKIAVNREGWHRVTAQQLIASGLDPGVEPRFLQLFVDGREIPCSVTGEQDGRLDQTDSIEFYGTGLDTAATDRRTYWLVAGSEPGERIRISKGSTGERPGDSFPCSIEHKDRAIYFSALRNGERDNFFGAVIAANPVDLSLTVRRLDKSIDADAELDVTLQGVTWAAHRVNVSLNNEDLGEVSFSGQSQGTNRLRLSQLLLREGENQVRLAAKGGAMDISLIDSIRLTYGHTFTADNDALRFTLEGGQQTSIDGFTRSEIKVLDITDPDDPYEVAGVIEPAQSGYRIIVGAAGAGQRTLLAFTTDQARTPARVSPNIVSDLRHTGQGANLLIITSRELRDSLNPLAALRRSQGLNVMVVDIEDVYDEFAFGHKSPHAIKEFLGFARTNWKKPPGFVLLAGDASLDPKNYMGNGDFDIVPTRLLDTDFLETASDDWFADFNSDGLAEMALGRLPVRTTQEADLVISKLINYERSSPSQEMLVVADANDGYNFEAASAGLRELIPDSITVRQINRGRLDPVTAKTQLIEAVMRGQKVINYAGHGSVGLWRGSLLTSADASEMKNGEMQPVFVMMTCLNGYFQDAGMDSLGESLIKAERGGAVAVWASTGMTMPHHQETMNREFYRLLFNGDRAVTLGEAAMRAKAATGDRDVRQTWVLLGDPTMRLR